MTANPEIYLPGQPEERCDSVRGLAHPIKAIEIVLPIAGEIILLHAHEAGVDAQWVNNCRGVGGFIGTAPTWRWAMRMAAKWLEAEGLA